MSGEKYIRQAIIASLCEHPQAEKYRNIAFSRGNLENVMEAMKQQKQVFTKEDLFTPDDNGIYIINHESAWKNFDKIAKALRDNGEKLTFEDFMRPVGYDINKTLLERAVEYGGLPHVFSFDIWQGRFEEMERLWYKVNLPGRKSFSPDGLIPLELKRKIFKAEGRTTPEDRLAKAGLTFLDVYTCFMRQEDFEAVKARLNQAGDYFRKEYALMRDIYGDASFDARQPAWDRYPAFVKILEENGERFEISDYLKQVSNMKHILGQAAEKNALPKIFTAPHWKGRLPDMLELWRKVLPGWKGPGMTNRDFDNAYAEAESLTYIQSFRDMALTGKSDLLKPLNAGAETEKPVLPLGLKAVWEKIDSVREILEGKGEKITLSDLRVPTGQRGDSLLLCAAKFDHFDKIIGISAQSKEAISFEDFTSRDHNGNTLISILAEKGQLALAFAPEIWAGRVQEMKKLWAEVPVVHRQGLNFPQAEVAAKQATLKLKKGGGGLRPKQPKDAP